MRLNDIQDTRKTTAAEHIEMPKYSLFNTCEKLAAMFGAIVPVDVL